VKALENQISAKVFILYKFHFKNEALPGSAALRQGIENYF